MYLLPRTGVERAPYTLTSYSTLTNAAKNNSVFLGLTEINMILHSRGQSSLVLNVHKFSEIHQASIYNWFYGTYQ